MYENLTALIPALSHGRCGEWIIDKKNDGSPEHPFHFPFVDYGDVVQRLTGEIYRFREEHPEFGLGNYRNVLRSHGIEWDADSMERAPADKLDGRTIMALLFGAVRAERFCDGALLGFCESGCIVKWLKRLRDLDGNNCIF